ncbi:PspC domain-containing protein [Schaalia sp. 19OD2882]|uniref:PspC domain-containing protein n=1 Tax=Schaalia sp. 19OD2882 TaxID=2794089 RepID=UPI001C1EA154|nr:PspC domain-containing protein [Schaalia sp. 19OD2882]QWW20019.1 PspC domain-containing protein [Schaalia sp. 19OD2882]
MDTNTAHPGASDWRTQGGPAAAGPAHSAAPPPQAGAAPADPNFHAHTPHASQGPRPTGFFNSLRYSGWYRSEHRVFGGVCTGIAEHFGWDPILVRGLTVILTLVLSPVAILYALGWILLPAQRDGRIALETLTHGDFEASHLGAAILLLAGLTGTTSFLSATLSSGGLLLLPGAFVLAVLVVVGVALYFAFDGGSRTPVPTPSPPLGGTVPPTQRPAGPVGAMPAHNPNTHPAPAAHGAAPMAGPAHPVPGGPTAPGAPAPGAAAMRGASGVYGAPAMHTMPAVPPVHRGVPGPQAWATAPGPAAPTPVAWVPPRPAIVTPRVVPTSWNLAVTGLVVLLIALTFLGVRLSVDQLNAGMGPLAPFGWNLPGQLILVGGGLCLLVVAVAMLIAAVKDRGAGWLIALSVFGMMLAGSTLLIGAGSLQSPHFVETGGLHDFESAITSRVDADWTDEEIHTAVVTDDLVLDLSTAPSDLDREITIRGAAVDNLRVFTRVSMPVRIVAHTVVDSVTITDSDGVTASRANEVAATPNGATVWHSATWREGRGITVHVWPFVDSLDVTLIGDEEASPAPLTDAPSEPTTPDRTRPGHTDQSQSTRTTSRGDAAQSTGR